MTKRRVLVVDDDAALRELMAMTLTKEGFEVATAGSWAAAEARLGDGRFALVVSDIYLGDGTGIDLLSVIQRLQPEARTILVTAHGTVETAAGARTGGAFDYLAKPFDVASLVDRVQAALTHPATTEAAPDGPESMIVGTHPAIVEVYKAVARVAPLPIPVLVRGETGTGKELIARALHRFGRAPGGPFVAVNCGAIPDTLLESELFGHRRGAFTGAVSDSAGAIERARGGTLFLDEVAELPPQLQVKLLRFLQSGEVQPVGGHHTVHVPLRVVSATHRDVRQLIADGALREDFFYRLAAYEIELPPLRQRCSDIPRLVEHFRRHAVDELGLADRGPASDELVHALAVRHWPGNVRELEHLVRRLLVDHGSLAEPGLARRLPPEDRIDSGLADVATPSIGDDLTLEELERRHLEGVIRRVGGNRTRAAEILGIERKSLYRKANRLGVALDPEEDEP